MVVSWAGPRSCRRDLALEWSGAWLLRPLCGRRVLPEQRVGLRLRNDALENEAIFVETP